MGFAYFDVLIALLAVGMACIWLTLEAKLPAALAPLCALSAVSLVLTAAGMAGVLRPAGLLLYGMCFVLGGFALYRALRPVGCGLRSALARLVTPGAAVFWLLTLGFAVCFAVRQPRFVDFDEFSLWGTAAKLTSTQNILYTEGEIGWPWQATQNPGMMLLSYFVQLLGTFAPWKTYLAYDMLLFACFGAALAGIRWKDYALAFPAAVICWISPFLLTVYQRTTLLCHVYFTSYGDIPAGLVFGGCVVFWFALRQQGGPFAALLPVLALCANIKSNTFVLSLAAAGIVAVDLVLFGGQTPWKKGLALRLGKAAAGFAVPLSTYLLWSRYTAALAAKNAAAGGMGTTSENIVSVAVNGIKMLLGLPVSEYYTQRQGRFVQAAADMKNAFLGTKITMLGSGLAVLCVIGALFVLAAVLAPGRAEKARAALLFVLFAACFVAYNFMLVLSYAFIFTESQGSQLIDYNRYLYTYYLGWFLAAVSLLCAAARQSRWVLVGKGGVFALACLCLLCFGRYISPGTSVLDYPNSSFAGVVITEQRAAQAKAVIEADPQRVGPAQTQRVFLVSQGDNGLNWFTYSYEFLPMVLDYSGVDREKESDTIRYGAGGGTFGTEEQYNQDPYYHAYTVQEFWDTVKASGCGYLFVETCDAVFTNSYAMLFGDGLAAAQAGPAVYRVTDTCFVPVTAGEATP